MDSTRYYKNEITKVVAETQQVGTRYEIINSIMWEGGGVCVGGGRSGKS